MPDESTPNEPTGDEGKTYTQAELDAAITKAAASIRADERRKVTERFADYDDLKAKASTAASLEERVAAMEERAKAAEVSALRAQYAADVPEKLRPLLTGTTDEELKAQRDLIVEGESERKKQGNHVPREGNNPQAGGDPMREFTRGLFARATSE